MNKEIILIDAGTGNLRSVQKALEFVGANVERTDDPRKVLAAKKVVLPGVGALFRNNSRRDNKTELLIFITPRLAQASGAR